MTVSLFVRALIVYISLALILYAVFPFSTFELLAKLIAFAIGAALLTPFAYPILRGVRKGDPLEVESRGRETMPRLLQMIFPPSGGVAMENGRTGQKIGVLLQDGSMRECVIVAYSGFFHPAKARLVEETEIKVV